MGDSRHRSADQGFSAPEPEWRGFLETMSADVADLHRRTRYAWAASAVAGRAALDVGCRDGAGTAALAAAASRATGIDPDPEAIVAAAERHGAVAEFVRGDPLLLPFDDGAFGAVVCFRAIDAVGDPIRALAEMKRVLEPDGILLISAPSPDALPDSDAYRHLSVGADELVERIRSAFAHVSVHRQSAHIASSVEPLSDRLGGAAPARDCHGSDAGAQLCTIVAASDATPPPVPARIELGGEPTAAAWLDRVAYWEARAREAEAEAALERDQRWFAVKAQRQADQELSIARRRPRRSVFDLIGGRRGKRPRD